MINFNGTIQSDTTQLTTNNRGFLYGDAVFETIKIADSKVLLLEEHYFRLMSSMRILRMEIPQNFTMEFFDAQLLLAAEAAKCSESARVRITMFRNDGGLYLPQSRKCTYVIAASPLASLFAAITQPSLLLKTITGFPFKSGLKTSSHEA